ncbi:hypothetical protein ACFPZ0_27300 [Streptomonospora nanhaiensis]|uniref:Uncharacterized protein n=1 Tax=Streptomonospora nanhaiensis TaxID=1323731 RepID=A0A853BWR9_9ACTN|nr:hypothetical protein [Streptomonospora nanhaiensis]MBV2363590.1 hypothetical protein [Streptomonospora nanhaiensis]NYI98632.1 hypothetical protein [Streptomonospora nanhaiensis]
MRVPSSVYTTAGLIGGYAAARTTKNRRLGGAVLAACGAAAFRSWRRSAGLPTAAALSAVYSGAFGLAHPLAKRMGAWPAVLAVTAATGAAAHVLADRRGGGRD